MQRSSLTIRTIFDLKSVLSDISIAAPVLLVSVCMEYYFLSFHLQLICVFGYRVNLLQTSYIWISPPLSPNRVPVLQHRTDRLEAVGTGRHDAEGTGTLSLCLGVSQGLGPHSDPRQEEEGCLFSFTPLFQSLPFN